MDATEERFARLETKRVYLEDFHEKLQLVTVEHSDMIARLKAENHALRQKMGELSDAVQDIPNVRPPHY